MDDILARVAQKTGISESEIMGRSRLFPIARARHLFMFRARKAGYSYGCIARYMGMDHTSVIHGVRRTIHDRKVASLSIPYGGNTALSRKSKTAALRPGHPYSTRW